jgi:nucleotide-binding universal stress UspA family protein
MEAVMAAIKDILALAIESTRDRAALAAADMLAHRFSASRSCVFFTALPDEPLAYEPAVVAGVWAELLNRARADANAERGKVEALLRQSDLPYELNGAEALARDLGRVAAVHARYADLTILTRPGEGGSVMRHDLVEGVLLNSGRPALIVPPDYDGRPIGRRPIIAWDATREATRALGDAQALIDGAEEVTVVTVDARPKAFGHGEQPGADIAAHLNRRGHKVDVRNAASGGESIAEVLLNEARAVNADLIVMGGYGHARLRELLFGGATRDLLELSPFPLFMAH